MSIAEPPAHELIGEISERLEARHLVPFGDGPFEVQLAEELKAIHGEGARAIVDHAAQVMLSRLVSPYAVTKDFRIFASLSFVARFAGMPLTDDCAAMFVGGLIKKAREDREAALALADYLRTLARTGAVVDVGRLPSFDNANDPTEILAAYAELLVAQERPGAVEVVGALIERRADVAGLLWNLAQEDHFVEELSWAGRPLGPDVRDEVEAALTAMDPSLAALAQWRSKCMTEEANDNDGSIERYSAYYYS